MKKIFYSILIIILILALFALPCFAEAAESESSGDTTETIGGTETTEDGAEAPKYFDTADEGAFLDQLIGWVSSSEFWGNFVTILLGVLALVATVRSSFSKIGETLSILKDFIAGKATKEETEAAIKLGLEEIRSTYESKLAELSELNESLTAKYDNQTAILSLVVLQLIKSPNARAQIMALLQDGNKLSGDVARTVATIEAEIEAADAREPKVETPALDSVCASVASTAEDAAPAEYVMLG